VIGALKTEFAIGAPARTPAHGATALDFFARVRQRRGGAAFRRARRRLGLGGNPGNGFAESARRDIGDLALIGERLPPIHALMHSARAEDSDALSRRAGANPSDSYILARPATDSSCRSACRA